MGKVKRSFKGNTKIFDSDGNPIVFEGSSTTVLTTKDVSIFYAESGIVFFTDSYIENSGAIDTSSYYSFTTPASDLRAYMEVVIGVDTDFEVIVYEGTTVSSGTTLTPYNKERNSTTTAEVVVKENPTIDVAGTSTVKTRQATTTYKIIAKRNTTYVFKITKKVVEKGTININLSWAERFATTTDYYLLTESGNFLVQENGDKLIL